MSRPFAIGLTARIVLSLAIVMTLFIVLTEVTVSRLVGVSVSRSAAGVSQQGEEAQSAEEVSAEIQRLRKFILFYMITGAVIAIALGALAIARTVVRPLAKVTRAVERVAQGDLDTEVPISGSGELIELGANFNRMTRTLREQRRELGEQLEELRLSSVDLKEAQDSLIRAAKLASVGTLAAGVAHEIGNPIAGVLGLLEAIEDEPDEKKRTEYLSLIRKEVGRIDRIISELLAYARPAGDGIGGGSTDPIQVIEHVWSLLGATRIFDKVEVTVDVEEGLSIAAERDELTQLLVNLLLNAAQAMGGGGSVWIRGESIRGWRPPLAVVERPAVRLTVTDDGPGVDPELADRIFDPFFSRREAGTGLGLAICQSICERAGGEIRLLPGGERGAAFEITLPGSR